MFVSGSGDILSPFLRWATECRPSQYQNCCDVTLAASIGLFPARTLGIMRVLALISAVFLNETVIAQPANRFDTWLAAPPKEQLYREGFDDQKGVGRIFVPAMTTPANEPLYAVFRDGKLVGERLMGSSFFLEPGTYTVILGTGNIEQRVHREVVVNREETVVIDPTWCSLTIEVIDESRNSFPQDLQIFNATTGESYGILSAINPELGEQLQTLILQPGLYKIVKRGLDFNTFVNFATLLLEPGVYTPFTVVINSSTITKDFTGAGIITRASQLRQLKQWKVYAAVHGNVIITSDNNTSKNLRTNLSLLSQLENRLLFDRFPHYYLSNNLLDLGALKQYGAKFVINQDRLQLKNSYVYFFLNWLGTYGRFDALTHLAPRIALFDSLRTITLHDTKGNFRQQKIGVTQFEKAPPIFPIELKEGIGVNITPLKRFNARLSIRSGLGYQQVYNHDNVYSEVSDALYKQVENSFVRGMEASLVSSLVFFQNVTVTTQLDVLFPFGGQKTIVDLENFVSLRITKQISLEHTFRLKQNPARDDYLIQEHLISVRLSYYFF